VIARDRVIAVIGQSDLDGTYNLMDRETDHPIDGKARTEFFDRGAQ
jgi:hypothetical protein